MSVNAPGEDHGDDNNNSLIAAVTFNGASLLFMGDAKKKRTDEFLESCADSYDLIKLPHHGDGNSALYELIEKTGPSYAVEMISDDETVEEKLLDALSEAGTKLFCTDKGEVRVEWTDSGLKVEQ